MIKIKDILFEILVGLILMITFIFLVIKTEFPFPLLIFIPFIGYIYLRLTLKRKKKLTKYVESDFEKIGYKIVQERPLKFSEQKIEIKPAVFINHIPLSRYGYIRQFTRVFKVKDKDNRIYELNTVITKKWNGENHIKIINKNAC